MQVEYDSEQVDDAFRAVFGAELFGDPLLRELSAPGGLGAAVAVELAGAIAPPDEVSSAATAALVGLCVGARLAGVGDRMPDALPAAVDTVRVLGRTRVIASHCDLADVARLEDAVAKGFGGGQGPPSVLQLFELGFAVGLAARYA